MRSGATEERNFHRRGRGARGEEMILIGYMTIDFSAISVFSAVNDLSVRKAQRTLGKLDHVSQPYKVILPHT